MSFISEALSALGIPAGTVTISVTIYLASIKAEREANRRALSDISRFLRRPLWPMSINPGRLIEQLFNATFGNNHFSLDCVARSFIATLLVGLCMIPIAVYLFGENNYSLTFFPFMYDWSRPAIYIPFYLFLVSVPSDYISLFKARLIVRRMAKTKKISVIFRYVILDLVLSFLISCACYLAALYFCIYVLRISNIYIGFGYGRDQSAIGRLVYQLEMIFYPDLVRKEHTILPNELVEWVVYDISFLATMFTSVWIILNLFSTTIVHILYPIDKIRGFTVWFLPINKHPIRSVGLVSSYIIILLSMILILVKHL